MAKKVKRTKNKDLGKKAVLFAINVATAAAVDEGLVLLNNQDFMQNKPDAAGVTSPWNVKKLGANGAALMIGGAIATMVDDEHINAIGTGMGSAAAINAKEEVKAGAGLNGLGNAEDFVSLYDDKSSMKGPDDAFQMANIETDAIKIA